MCTDLSSMAQSDIHSSSPWLLYASKKLYFLNHLRKGNLEQELELKRSFNSRFKAGRVLQVSERHDLRMF